MRASFVFGLVLICAASCLCGCGQGASDDLPPEPDLLPVTGKVTVQGKPLATAVVTFLPTDAKGTLSVGETGEDGEYEITYMGKPGTAAARYKVSISYIQGKDGTVYGLGPRSGLSKPYGLVTGKERLVPEWSDLGRTTHEVTIPEKGGTFDFDIAEPLLPPPDPDPPTQGEPAKEPTSAVKEPAKEAPAPTKDAAGPASKTPVPSPTTPPPAATPPPG